MATQHTVDGRHHTQDFFDTRLEVFESDALSVWYGEFKLTPLDRVLDFSQKLGIDIGVLNDVVEENFERDRSCIRPGTTGWRENEPRATRLTGCLPTQSLSQHLPRLV